MRQLTQAKVDFEKEQTLYRGAHQDFCHIQRFQGKLSEHPKHVLTKRAAYMQIIKELEGKLEWYQEKYEECNE